MTSPGYQEGGEQMRWWKVAQRLDEAQLALANAMAHNVDDPAHAHALYDRLREGQTILLDIFRAKGLLPESVHVPPAAPTITMPAVPVSVDGDDVVAASLVEQASLLAVAEPAVPESDQDAAASDSEQDAVVLEAPPTVVPPAASGS
jgi:hypothetical protein